MIYVYRLLGSDNDEWRQTNKSDVEFKNLPLDLTVRT